MHDDVVREYIDVIIDEFRSWNNHPFKVDLSIEIARLLMCLDRRDDAKEFYMFLKKSGVSEHQMAAWAREEIQRLEAEFGEADRGT